MNIFSVLIQLFSLTSVISLAFQTDLNYEEIKQILTQNPSYFENINNSQVVQSFSEQPILKKFLYKKANGAVNVNWQKLFESPLGHSLIKKSLNERSVRKERSVANIFDFIINLLKNLLAELLGIPSCEKMGIKYSTNKTKLPDKINWSEIGFAKELLNNLNRIVVIAGGKNPINNQKWEEFKPTFPYRKNIDRNLLFRKTFFARSPDTDANCQNDTCIKQVDYKDYTWIEMAKIVCSVYIPIKKDAFNPPPGYLVSNTIKKCQSLYFENEIYQLSDGQGNFYVMHAFEKNGPNLSVVLPSNWKLKKISILEPFIVTPFGSENDCYFNILRDSLGQGYHQYAYAGKFYP